MAKEYINNRAFYDALIERKNQILEAEKLGKPKPEISKYICECIIHICERLAYSPRFSSYTYLDEMIGDAKFNCITNIDKFETNIISMSKLEDIDTSNLKNKRLFGVTSGAEVIIKSYNKESKRIIAKTITDEQPKLMQKERAYFIKNDGERVEFTLNGITYSNAFAYFTQCAWNAYVGKIKSEKKETRAKAAIFQSVQFEFMDIQDHDGDENYSNGYVDFMRQNAYLDIDLSPKKDKNKKPTIESMIDEE